MKVVLTQYASAVIGVLVALTLLVVWQNGEFFQSRGISQVLGKMLAHSIGDMERKEVHAFRDYLDTAAPVIEEKTLYTVVKQEMKISDCLEARSVDGKKLSVFAEAVWQADGEKMELDMLLQNDALCFAEAGAYWVQVVASDMEGRTSRKIVRVLVNER